MLKLRGASQMGRITASISKPENPNGRRTITWLATILITAGLFTVLTDLASAATLKIGTFPDSQYRLPPAIAPVGPLTTPGRGIYGGISINQTSGSATISAGQQWETNSGYWFGYSVWGVQPPTSTDDARCLGPDCSWYLDPQQLTLHIGGDLRFPVVTKAMGPGGYQGDPSGGGSHSYLNFSYTVHAEWGGQVDVKRSAIGNGEPLKTDSSVTLPVRVCIAAGDTSWYQSSCHALTGPGDLDNAARLTITVPPFPDTGPVCTLFPWSPSSITLNGVYNSSNDQPNPSGGWQATGDVQHSTISVLCSGAPGSIGMNLKYNGFESPQADRDNSADGMVFPFTGLPNLGVVTKWNILTESVGGCFSNYTFAPGHWMLENCTVAPVISDVATSDAMISGFPDVIVNNFSSSSSFPAEFKWGVDIIGYRRPPSSTGPGIPGKVSGTASGTIMMSVTVQ